MTQPEPGGPDAAAARHQRIKQLFLTALEVPRARRAAFLAEACGGDDGIRREVLELFLLHGDEDSVLDAPLDPSVALAGLDAAATAQAGPWRLLRELGRGGMGVVHLAERDGALAAVKLLGSAALSPEARERFRLEADILHRLDHPGIARVLDEGDMAGPGGVPLPWIAMEYVEGRRLLEHAEAAGLSVKQRLALLAAVCDAVQHAHSHGIVHRDLKPSNILVRPDGRPVVLDFGVARLTGDDQRPTELATRTGQLVGTPQYMSPEQVQGEPSLVGPRSDVYSLGIIAYELLAGRLPYQASSVSLHRAVATILTVEPAPLGKVVPEFRGALERITGKALEKSPALRYASAGELADDVRRHLDGRTVRARGPGLMRRVQRWSATRRRLVAGLVALTGATLIVAAWLLGGGRGVPRARILANYREAEGLFVQAVPLLYEGERTPERLQQAIDRYTRARTLIEQVPPLPHHDALLRTIEKDLGTALFLLGERTWDIAPTRAAVSTLLHAASLPADTIPGSQKSIQVPELSNLYVPQTTLLGLLVDSELTLNRQWGEPSTLEYALQRSIETLEMHRRALHSRKSGRRLDASPEVDPFAYNYNTLAQVLTDYARFQGSVERAREAVTWSDSAFAHRETFRNNWPALGSMLYERGRAWRTLGALTASSAALDSAERYLIACGDFRGPDRPWVFAETREERALLALDRAWLPTPVRATHAGLQAARAGLDSALRVMAVGGYAPAASAALRALDAELLAELAARSRRPALVDSAERLLESATPLLPATALPRRAGLAWISEAVLERTRFELSRDPARLLAAQSALDRASIVAEQHHDSTVITRVNLERARLARAAPTRR